jgi:hypothetical protein
VEGKGKTGGGGGGEQESVGQNMEATGAEVDDEGWTDKKDGVDLGRALGGRVLQSSRRRSVEWSTTWWTTEQDAALSQYAVRRAGRCLFLRAFAIASAPRSEGGAWKQAYFYLCGRDFPRSGHSVSSQRLSMHLPMHCSSFASVCCARLW